VEEDRRSEGFVNANCRSAAASLGLLDVISVIENIIYDKIKEKLQSILNSR